MATVISPQQALARLQNLCSRGEKCVADIRNKLIAWKMSAEDSAEIIKSLLEAEYIDEERYAVAFVRDKSRFSHWGAIKIQAALKAKNISQAIIGKALKELEELNYEGELEDLLRRKMPTVKAKDRHDLKVKLLRFALSRGYEYDLAYKYISKLITENL